MKIIGLTGSSGAGKSFCSNFFSKYDIPCIDTDSIYHKLLILPSKCADELIKAFGKDIVDDQNTINRKKLADIVFDNGNRSQLELLNQITHKFVIEKAKEIIKTYQSQNKIATVIDAPLLFESEFDKFCDFTIAIVADKQNRIKRIMERDSLSHDAVLKRINAQPSDDFYFSRAKYTIHNNADNVQLNQQLKKILIDEKILM